MKQKPSSFTDEEKHLIRQMKQELIAAGVPNKEILLYIQKELSMYRSEQKNKAKTSSNSKSLGPIRRAFIKIKEQGMKILQKILQKTIFRSVMNQNQDPFGMSSTGDNELPLFRPDDPDWEQEVNQHSSSLQPDKQQKRIIVDLDDDDE